MKRQKQGTRVKGSARKCWTPLHHTYKQTHCSAEFQCSISSRSLQKSKLVWLNLLFFSTIFLIYICFRLHLFQRNSSFFILVLMIWAIREKPPSSKFTSHIIIFCGFYRAMKFLSMEKKHSPLSICTMHKVDWKPKTVVTTQTLCEMRHELKIHTAP